MLMSILHMPEFRHLYAQINANKLCLKLTTDPPILHNCTYIHLYIYLV